MMRANVRVPAPRGAAAHCDAGGLLRADRQAEEMLKVFFADAADGALMPSELRGLTDGAQNGPPGVRRTLVMEGHGERLRIEVTAVGKGKTQLHLWREPLPEPLQAGPEAATATPADGLTQREREVALLVADGLRSREVAERLGIASQTVKSHLKTIFDKLGVRNRVELARRLVQH
ncbi:transcriptional regulator, LuxR family [Anaeromyxobacter dehalogenans 2CP-C]|uniref:Transcriptional regulator, LuxR family n=2 Tax=Anaeromyxobacteraceae TaxID=1524215 RepID=Q2IF59_ANADE|nr:transcriptional regulator, LuxR family [Anaeromyxobacter dehalogenans 2CP-C]